MTESAIASPVDAPPIAGIEPRPAGAGITISAPALGAATGLLLWLAYFPVAWSWLAWAALVPLLSIAVGRRSSWAVFFGSWVAGLAFFVPALEWLRVAHPMMYFTWIGLALYCSLYFPVAVGLIRFLHRRTALPLVVTVPAVWTGLEYVRAHLMTGFPWYFLAHAQHDVLPLIQIADVTGAYGVSFLVAAVNALLLEGLTVWPWFRARFGVARPLVSPRALGCHAGAVCALLTLVFGYGFYRLSESPFTDGPRIALLQSNLEQGVKNDAGGDSEAAAKTVLTSCTELATRAARSSPRPDLIVWPETSFPYLWSQLADGVQPRFLSSSDRQAAAWTDTAGEDLAEQWRTPLLLGVTREVIPAEGPRTRYNAAVLVDRRGKSVAAYDKMHRVPFGEYTPLRETFPWLRALTPYDHDDFSVAAGASFTRFPLGAYHFGVVICYEDGNPTLARQYVGSETPVDFLINISNDGWFRGTREHEQHLAICRFRAVECRRSVARAVNMGVSAVIDGNGRVLAPERTDAGKIFLARVAPGAEPLPVNRWHEYKSVAGVLTAVMPIDHRVSLYAARGDWLPTGCGGLICGALALGLFRPKRDTEAPGTAA
jgi:apolipoprotein N-acyltransferase